MKQNLKISWFSNANLDGSYVRKQIPVLNLKNKLRRLGKAYGYHLNGLNRYMLDQKIRIKKKYRLIIADYMARFDVGMPILKKEICTIYSQVSSWTLALRKHMNGYQSWVSIHPK